MAECETSKSFITKEEVAKDFSRRQLNEIREFDETKIPELAGLKLPSPDENYGIKSKTFGLMLDVYHGYIPATLEWPKKLFSRSQEFILIGNMHTSYLSQLRLKCNIVRKDLNVHSRSIRTYASYLHDVILHYQTRKEERHE